MFLVNGNGKQEYIERPIFGLLQVKHTLVQFCQ